MRITEGGNVGIGLTNPSYKLHVVGSTDIINATSTTTDARINIGHSGNGGYVGFANIGAGQASNTFYVTNGSGVIGSGITMNNGGFVGIGTTTPTEILHLNSGNAASFIRFQNTGGSGTYIGSRNANIEIYTGGSEKLRITSDGSFAIGTTAPRAILSVEQDYATTAEFGSQGQFSISGRTNPEKRLSMGFNTSTDVGFIQAMVNGTSYNSLLLNARGGNVGIGTTSPGATLDVNGSIYVSGEVSGRSFPFNTLIGSGADATTTTIRAGSTSGFQSAIFLEGGNVSNTIRFNTASAERMRITNIGRVGIGTTSPYGPLHVVGGTTIHNGPQTFSRVELVFGQTGTFTQVKVIFNKTNWGSVTYDIKLASAGGTYHTAGAYYSNPGFSNDLVSISVGSGISVSKAATSPLGGTQGATWTFSGATMIHPMVTVDIACGNGFQVTPESIVVEFS